MYYYLSLYLIIITSIHPYKYICAPWCAHGNQMVGLFLIFWITESLKVLLIYLKLS